MALMTAMLRANAFSMRMTTAVSLAQDVVDDLMQMSYALATSGQDRVSIYNRLWTVTTDASMKTVDVTVSWSSIDGDIQRVTLSTMIDDRD